MRTAQSSPQLDGYGHDLIRAIVPERRLLGGHGPKPKLILHAKDAPELVSLLNSRNNEVITLGLDLAIEDQDVARYNDLALIVLEATI